MADNDEAQKSGRFSSRAPRNPVDRDLGLESIVHPMEDVDKICTHAVYQSFDAENNAVTEQPKELPHEREERPQRAESSEILKGKRRLVMQENEEKDKEREKWNDNDSSDDDEEEFEADFEDEDEDEDESSSDADDQDKEAESTGDQDNFEEEGPSTGIKRKRIREEGEADIIEGLSGDEVDPNLILEGGRGSRRGRAGGQGMRPKYTVEAQVGSDEDEW